MSLGLNELTMSLTTYDKLIPAFYYKEMREQENVFSIFS